MALRFLTNKHGIKLPVLLPGLKGIESMKELAKLVHEDPLWVAENMYGLKAWRGPSPDEPGQAEVLEAIFQHRFTKISVTSGHGTGKTYLSTVIPHMWFDMNPWSYVLVTGADWIAVEHKLIPGIKEVAKFQQHMRPIDKWDGTHWRIQNNWELIGLSPDNGVAAQGWHSVGFPKHGLLAGTLILCDESSHLTYAVHSGFNSLVMSELDCYLQLGNPTSITGPQADIIRQPKEWHTMRIDSRYNPNYRERRTVIPGLCTVKMVDDYALAHGEDSAEFGIRVAGKLPEEGQNTLISMKAMNKARDRTPLPLSEDGALTVNVDVARSVVGDESVIMLVGQTTIHYVDAGQGWTQPVLLEKIRRIWDRHHDRIDCINIDAIGIGSGATDQLVASGYPVRPIYFSHRAHDIIQYANCRAEAWDNMRIAIETFLAIPEWVESDGGKKIKLWEKIAQAATVQKDHKVRDQLRLETKDKYKERTKQNSPDWADALSLKFARLIGDPAFPMLVLDHLRSFTPQITKLPNNTGWNWHLEGMPAVWDLKGKLARLTWLAPSGASACVLVFVDEDNCWLVFDCLIARETIVQDFWRRVLKMSHGLEFDIDLVSGQEDPTGNAEFHTINTLATIDSTAFPLWIRASDISGRKGLDYIEMMLLSSLARMPENNYWINNAIGNPDAYAQEQQLYFFNRDAYEAVAGARRKTRTSRDPDFEEDVPEGLIADGGPVVRGLRMLAIKAGAYAV